MSSRAEEAQRIKDSNWANWTDDNPKGSGNKNNNCSQGGCVGCGLRMRRKKKARGVSTVNVINYVGALDDG